MRDKDAGAWERLSAIFSNGQHESRSFKAGAHQCMGASSSISLCSLGDAAALGGEAPTFSQDLRLLHARRTLRIKSPISERRTREGQAYTCKSLARSAPGAYSALSSASNDSCLLEQAVVSWAWRVGKRPSNSVCFKHGWALVHGAPHDAYASPSVHRGRIDQAP